MNHDDLIEISNGTMRIKSIGAMAQRFIAEAATTEASKNVPAQLQVNGAELAVTWNAVTAKAVGRTVRVSDGTFKVEYIFRVSIDNETIEVARFYLNEGGKIWADPEEKQPVCDYNNSYLATNLCGRVVLGMLSCLFVPAAIES